MREIALFVEDNAHRQVIGALVCRIAEEYNIPIHPDWRNVVRGHGKVIAELDNYIRDLKRQRSPWPDLIVVATDANCKGLNERTREIVRRDAPAPMILAIPDPHIERWLLLDGAAFKAVFGKGCDAPDQKCARDRYKQRLIEAIYATGITPRIGGIEYAEDIIQKMNINRAARADNSFNQFVSDLRNIFRGWQA
ncbi:MAG: DUF4276 family protein [Gemmatimonadota bacterium]|nr:DUF4276 family protein [Gemmatimonadota bacterium]